MDILDKLVDFAQLTGSVDVQCLLGGQWSVRHETLQREGLVHIVTSGSGYLCIDGETSPRPVSTGDIVFFPRGLGHVLSHDGKCGESLQPDMRQHGAFTVKQCGNGQDMSLFCARFRYDTHADLMNGLPETVFLNIAHPSLQYVVSMLQLESEKPLTGTVSVVNALSSVLLVLILRAYLEQDKDVELSGVLKGWQDKRLGHLIQKVIDKPEDEWNVDKMVATANMSRAQLMRRFKSRVGLSPHAFVNHIRLQKGALLLKKKPGFGFVGRTVGRLSVGNALRQGVQTAISRFAGSIPERRRAKINRGFKRKCRLKRLSYGICVPRHFKGCIFITSIKKLVNAGLLGLTSIFFQRCCQPRKAFWIYSLDCSVLIAPRWLSIAERR